MGIKTYKYVTFLSLAFIMMSTQDVCGSFDDLLEKKRGVSKSSQDVLRGRKDEFPGLPDTVKESKSTGDLSGTGILSEEQLREMEETVGALEKAIDGSGINGSSQGGHEGQNNGGNTVVRTGSGIILGGRREKPKKEETSSDFLLEENVSDDEEVEKASSPIIIRERPLILEGNIKRESEYLFPLIPDWTLILTSHVEAEQARASKNRQSLPAQLENRFKPHELWLKKNPNWTTARLHVLRQNAGGENYVACTNSSETRLPPYFYRKSQPVKKMLNVCKVEGEALEADGVPAAVLFSQLYDLKVRIQSLRVNMAFLDRTSDIYAHGIGLYEKYLSATSAPTKVGYKKYFTSWFSGEKWGNWKAASFDQKAVIDRVKPHFNVLDPSQVLERVKEMQLEMAEQREAMILIEKARIVRRFEHAPVQLSETWLKDLDDKFRICIIYLARKSNEKAWNANNKLSTVADLLVTNMLSAHFPLENEPGFEDAVLNPYWYEHLAPQSQEKLQTLVDSVFKDSPSEYMLSLPIWITKARHLHDELHEWHIKHGTYGRQQVLTSKTRQELEAQGGEFATWWVDYQGMVAQEAYEESIKKDPKDFINFSLRGPEAFNHELKALHAEYLRLLQDYKNVVTTHIQFCSAIMEAGIESYFVEPAKPVVDDMVLLPGSLDLSKMALKDADLASRPLYKNKMLRKHQPLPPCFESTSVKLEFNHLTGSLANGFPYKLAVDPEKITHLYLSNNGLTRLDFLHNLPQLEHLDLSQQKKGKDEKTLVGRFELDQAWWPSLTFLDLSYNGLTGIAFIGEKPWKLVELRVNDNKLLGVFECFETLQALQTLHVQRNDFDGEKLSSWTVNGFKKKFPKMANFVYK